MVTATKWKIPMIIKLRNFEYNPNRWFNQVSSDIVHMDTLLPGLLIEHHARIKRDNHKTKVFRRLSKYEISPTRGLQRSLDDIAWLILHSVKYDYLWFINPVYHENNNHFCGYDQ